MCNSQKVNDSADSTYLRKIRKPMIEKKRRERMNKSLSQLKAILLESDKENGEHASRWDKAEILDLTVDYIQQLRHQRRSATMATGVAKAYGTGFRDCARTTLGYLSSSQCVSPTELSRLNNHLQNTYNEKMSATTTPVSLTTQATSALPMLTSHPAMLRMSESSSRGNELCSQSDKFPGRINLSFGNHADTTPISNSSARPVTAEIDISGTSSVNILHEEKLWRPW